jgi:hypothetical protein
MTSLGEGPEAPPRRRSTGQGWPALPLLLALFALWDVRDDLLLLLDRPTITAGLYLVVGHPLAMLVLLLQPILWRRYRRS